MVIPEYTVDEVKGKSILRKFRDLYDWVTGQVTTLTQSVNNAIASANNAITIANGSVSDAEQAVETANAASQTATQAAQTVAGYDTRLTTVENDAEQLEAEYGSMVTKVDGLEMDKADKPIGSTMLTLSPGDFTVATGDDGPLYVTADKTMNVGFDVDQAVYVTPDASDRDSWRIWADAGVRCTYIGGTDGKTIRFGADKVPDNTFYVDVEGVQKQEA